MKTKTVQSKGRPVDLTHSEHPQVISLWKGQDKEVRGQSKGPWGRLPILRLSPNQRIHQGSTHQAVFQNNCGLVSAPFSISEWETWATLQNVGWVCGRIITHLFGSHSFILKGMVLNRLTTEITTQAPHPHLHLSKLVKSWTWAWAWRQNHCDLWGYCVGMSVFSLWEEDIK